MHVVIVEFTVAPDRFETFLTRVRRQASDSLASEPDCLQFDVCVDPERDDFVFLYEIYRDRKAFEAHLASAHFLQFDADVRDWVSDKKVSLLEKR